MELRTTNLMRLSAALALAITAAGCGKQRPPSASLGTSHELERLAVEEAKHHELGAVRELVISREPWQFADAEGHLITTPNYRLYTTVAAEDFLDRLPRFYEAALAHYTAALGPLPQPSDALETFLFRTRSQWQAKTAEMLPEQSRMFSNLGRGGFTTKGTSVLYYIDRRGYPRDTLAIAAHEGWHQYTQRTFKQQLPIWLEEGVATYMEGYRPGAEPGAIPRFDPVANYERRETLRDAVRDDSLISLNELLTRTPQSFLNQSKDMLLTYYAQVWALTRFLAEGQDGRYRPALEQVLRDAAEGDLVERMMASSAAANSRRRGGAGTRVGPAVAQEYFNRDLSQLESQYLVFIDQVIRQEGRRRGG